MPNGYTDCQGSIASFVCRDATIIGNAYCKDTNRPFGGGRAFSYACVEANITGNATCLGQGTPRYQSNACRNAIIHGNAVIM